MSRGIWRDGRRRGAQLPQGWAEGLLRSQDALRGRVPGVCHPGREAPGQGKREAAGLAVTENCAWISRANGRSSSSLPDCSSRASTCRSGVPRFDSAVMESLQLVKWYAREHVLLCLVPAFFIAGAIGVFVSQASVMKYLGAGANKIPGLRRGLRLRERSGRLLVHGAAAVRRHLQDGRRPGSGHRISLLRPGDQRPGDHPDRADSRRGDGHRAGGRGGRLQHHHRAADAPDLPQGGSRQSGPPDGHARTPR